MKFLPREKQKIDFLALATKREENPWLAGFYFVVGVLLFGYLFYEVLFGGG